MTSACSALSPCFMVYPVPSIGDESLLQVLFHNKVARSVFAGYGVGRLAIVELTDEELVQKVCAELEKAKQAAEVRTAEITASALGLDSEDGNKKNRKAQRQQSTALVEDWLSTLLPNTTDAGSAAAGGDADNITLADLFAQPHHSDATEVSTGKKSALAKSKMKTGALFDVTDTTRVDHLTALHWRGHPLHVVVSPITVEEFYACGGTVPTHAAAKKKRGRDDEYGGEDDTGASPRKGKRIDDASHTAREAPPASFPKNCCQKCGSADHFTRHCDGSGPGSSGAVEAQPPGGDAGVAAQQAPSGRSSAVLAPASFPKNCCQKCGSADHFTRHCDGSGPGSSGAVEAQPPGGDAGVAAQQAPSGRSSAVLAPASFPKNCCQKCGSADHFTRHCDGSGAGSSVATKVMSIPVAPPVKAAPAPVAVAPPPRQASAPVVVRTSKDQCKHCGSDDHLSRHCPNK